MQFVKNGPDVPERLLQAHEDGRVVLFSGAGISYPARLPGFGELVKNIYRDLGITPDAVQQAAIKAKKFDTATGLLESQIVGGREKVRNVLANILMPDLDAPNATSTHEALLTLSRNRDGYTRLITTNFDRLFEEVIANKGLDIERFQAPLLPVPKSRWVGLVYLHGLLPAMPTASELNRLVVSSGDFGLAYLIERWAARFVGELFRNYTVCFVGYSIDDPVLRYMTDALAADRLLGELPLEMFAFDSYSKGRKNERANDWRAKNVTPILYRKHKRHLYLHKTLRLWAETHRDGILSKERIVIECAGLRPLASTKQDDFVGRALWALSDPGGLPAQCFADLDPVPSLDWLEPLCEDRYRQADLSRFGVQPGADKDDMLTYNLMHRPSPYTHAPWMALVDENGSSSKLDDVAFHLARWLIRHLDDPALVLWLAKRGGQLHREFVGQLETLLEKLDRLERDGERDELRRILHGAPNAIPRPMMRTLWRLMLTGRVVSSLPILDNYRWMNRFEHNGLTATLRLELRDVLKPRVSLRESFHFEGDQEDLGEPEKLNNIVDWEILLSANDVRFALHDLRAAPHWIEALPGLLDDFSTLLRDAMDLMRELGGAKDKSDPSYYDLPSIAEHPQNENSHDWTTLIELTRDAWLQTAKIAPERARLAAETWRHAPYPVFQRLAFFAAAQEESIIPLRQALDWLLDDDYWWLWSEQTQRETMRLVVTLASKLDRKPLAELEQAVLAGPPRSMYNDDIEAEAWVRFVEREVWLFLAKMDDSGTALGTNAQAKLDELISQHPEWRVAEGERDEFPFWMGVEGESRRSVVAPRLRRELVAWLKQHPGRDDWQDDDWLRRCRNDFPTTACALYALAKDDEWPVDRWRRALQAWSEERLMKRSWRYMAQVLDGASDDELEALAHVVSRWLKEVAKALDTQETLFLRFCQRILTLDYQDDEDEDTDDLVSQAINHPVGHVTEALLNWWYRSGPEDDQGLQDEYSRIFTELCDVQVGKFRYGRVLLTAHVLTLFRVDREWATRHILVLFDWQRSNAGARAAWKAFLWSPRIYRPFMESIKDSFLDTAYHYETLGKHGTQYTALLTYAALGRDDTFTTKELAIATKALPEQGLRHSAQILAHALERAGDQRSEYWQNRVVPYLQSIWPKSRDNKTPAISECFGRVCVAAQDHFPDALTELRHWLTPPQYPSHLIHRLRVADLCRRFPEPALTFLDLVTGTTPPLPTDLNNCLEQIKTAEPQLEHDLRFQTLLSRRRRVG